MSVLHLCVADDKSNRFARIAPMDGLIRRIEATSDFVAEVDEALAAVLHEPMVREEFAIRNGRSIGVRSTTPDDPLLLDQLAVRFRLRRYSAVLLDERRAEAWSLLRQLPLELDIRDTLSPGLPAMPEEDIADLLALLHDAVKETREMAAKLAKEQEAALAAQRARHDEEIAALAAAQGGNPPAADNQ